MKENNKKTTSRSKKNKTISKTAEALALPVKVSVIISVYNAEDYLRDCLDSLLNQTLGDIEIIAIDDSSDDASFSILEEYAKKDARLVIEQQPHSGAASARNKGLSMARGEYLSILDADDFFEPDMLEKAYENAKDKNADIVVFKSDLYDQKEGDYKENSWSILQEKLPGDVFNANDIPDKIFNIGAGWAWDKLFRKDFVEACDISFQDLRTTNDMLFVFYLYTRAGKISFLNEVLAHRRINNDKSLSSTREESWEDVFFALKGLKDRLESEGVYNKFRQSFVNWALNLLLWHIKTLKKREADSLKAKCREEYFDILDITGHEEHYFYDEDEKAAMQIISEGPVAVSVIIPVYNASAYLRQCLDSVCNQTLRNIEIICVDDGSTDESYDILCEYASRDFRIHVIPKDHSNAGESRNAGLEIATGEYLSFLDADDFFEPHMLETVYRLSKDDDSDVCVFRSNHYDHNSGEFYDTPWTLRDWEMPAHRPFSADDVHEKIFNMCGCTAWDKLFKKDFIFENVILFQSNLTSNDMLFTFTALSLAKKISTVDEVLAHMRVGHPKGLAKDVEYCTSCFASALLILKECLEERGIYEKFKKSYVNWAVDFSLFNMHIFEGVFSNLIRQKLKLRYFDEMDISSMPEEDFYNHDQYVEMVEILSERKESYPNGMPKVSVIIPIYNVAHYLPMALDSAIYQTLEDIEIICVNDGSTDNSLEIIEDYAAKDPRIMVITGENNGYGHAMNIGMEAARGEYIGIIEPDDFVDVNMFEELYKIAKANGLDFVKSDFSRFVHDDFGNIVPFHNKVVTDDSYYNKVITPNEELDSYRFTMNTWTGIYSRGFIFLYDIRHNETPGAAFQDNGFWFQTMMYATRSMFIDRCFYMNRRDNSDSSVYKTCNPFAIIDEHTYIYSLLSKNKECFDKLIAMFHVIKLQNYFYRLNYVEKEDEKRYLETIQNEFIHASEQGELDISLFNEEELENYNWLINHSLELEVAKELTFNKVTIHDMINFDNKTPSKVKVSVIVPIYNVEAYLAECLESAINQTLKEIEIICVNDGSTDSCLEIAKKYAALDSRVKVINKDNAGYGHTMNIGMDMARGEYIAILESDDYVRPDMYEYLYNIASKDNIDIVRGDFYRFTRTNGFERVFYNSISNDEKLYNKIISVETAPGLFKFAQTWAGIYNREFLNTHSIRHQETPGASFQDNGFWFLTTVFAKSIFHVRKPFYMNRRDNPSSSVYDSSKAYMVNLEFKYINDNIIDQNYIDYDQYAPFYFRKKYDTYLNNYRRISPELKKEYIEYISEEFRSDMDRGIIIFDKFKKSEVETINLIIEDPLTYYENTKNEINEVYLDDENNEDSIHVVFVCDDGYAIPTATAIASIVDSKDSDTKYSITIIAIDMSDENIRILDSMKREDLTIRIVAVQIDRFDELSQIQLTNYGVPTSALVKFIIPKVLPMLDKVIYLDGDICVQKDLTKLYNENINDCYAGVIRDIPQVLYAKQVFGIPYGSEYFNSGVMLLNIKKMLEDKISERLIDTKMSLKSNLMDQDVFNEVFKDNSRQLSIEYNTLFVNLIRSDGKYQIDQINGLYKKKYQFLDDIRSDSSIIHYCSSDKPWKYYDVPVADKWLKYFYRSPYGNKPIKRRSVSEKTSVGLNGKIELLKKNSVKGIPVAFIYSGKNTNTITANIDLLIKNQVREKIEYQFFIFYSDHYYIPPFQVKKWSSYDNLKMIDLSAMLKRNSYYYKNTYYDQRYIRLLIPEVLSEYNKIVILDGLTKISFKTYFDQFKKVYDYGYINGTDGILGSPLVFINTVNFICNSVKNNYLDSYMLYRSDDQLVPEFDMKNNMCYLDSIFFE